MFILACDLHSVAADKADCMSPHGWFPCDHTAASAGHGDSTRFRSAPVTADLLCADARAFILARELYVRPLVLVAAGLSAAAAARLAVQDPALVGGLVLLRPELQPLGFFPGQAAAFAGAREHSLSSELWHFLSTSLPIG